MIVLEMYFPAGRFHATPWGRHVNEGAIEWPPSPWRLLRALIATWHLKAQHDLPQATVRSLMTVLASRNPCFLLPIAEQGHTRHYMPFNEGGSQKTTKVFDAFVQISPQDKVLVGWDVTLLSDEFAALQMLTDRIGYLGRAESLVQARVLNRSEPIRANAAPLLESASQPPGKEIVRLLAPLTPDGYDAWAIEFTSKAEGRFGGNITAAQRRSLPNVPRDLFAALQVVTGDLHAAGWNLPPGAAHVNYVRDEAAFFPPKRVMRPRSVALPSVARYLVVSAVSPRITQAVSVSNRVHEALCKWSNQESVFTGKDQTGNPLSGHRHAHIFCEGNGPRDAITHITIWSADGFGENALLALRRLNKVWGHGGHDLRIVLTGIGQPCDFEDCQIFFKTKVWRSATPFVSTRHAKSFRDGRPKIDTNGWQVGSAGHDLLRLLALDSRTSEVTMRKDADIHVGGRTLRSLQFQTVRHDGGGSRGNDDEGAFTISFNNEVEGPLAFGYGSHFGLGLFIPVASSRTIPA